MAELEATYALLTQAAATDQALRSRLRSSQALVWGDQALMLTRVAPSGLSYKPVSAPVDLRFKRRMEWEVSRRIARVDRELRDMPPGQRFWHRKKKLELEQNARERTQADAAASKERRAAKMAGVANESQKRVVRPKKTMMPLRIRTSRSQESSPVQSPLVGKAPRKKTDEQIPAVRKRSAIPKKSSSDLKTTETRTLLIHESPVESPVKIVPKENEQPNEIKRVAAAVVGEESSADDVLPNKDPAALNEDLKRESTKPKTEVIHDPVALKLELEQEAPRQEPPAPSFSPKHDGNIALSSPSSSHQSSSPGHSSNNQRRPPPWQNPSVSSLGRQVLSEFRSSGGPSFGLPPISTSARGQPRQLNRDVLRRLFSDLDSDKDGHLNRIETCLALHRLQIVVPAAKIASFFRHIYDSSESRDDYVEPWKEVISYAQFVAFVTAAHEKQQQDQQSRPIRRQRKARQLEVPPRDDLVRQYVVVESDQDEDNTANAVLQRIPDYLVGRLLSEPTRNSVKNSTAVVRRSLEKFLPAKHIQDEDVIAIAQDLIKNHMMSIEKTQGEMERDTTGLLRAAAYFENVQWAGGMDGMVSQDDDFGAAAADIHNQTEWLNKLTEEQVTCMVQELWKERQQTKIQEPHTKIRTEEEPEEDRNDQVQEFIVEDQVNSGHISEEKATDMSDFQYTMHLDMVSEKAIQVDSEVDQNNIKIQENPISDLQITQKAQAMSSRSNLANALLHFSEQNGIAPDLQGGETSVKAESDRHIAILQAMRQRRKQYQAASVDKVREPPTPSIPPIASTTGVQFDSFIRDEQSRSSISIGTDNDGDFKEPSEAEDNDMGIQSSTDETPTLIRTLTAPVFVERYQSNDALISSMSNDSYLSGASDIQGSTELSPCLFSPLNFKPRARTYNPRRSGASSRSSYRDSIVSEDLSEGEIQGSDLSDGEIYGPERKQLIRFKNRSPHILNETSNNSEHGTSVGSSIESGELLPINKVHRHYRHHLMTSSSSSIESGELELGLMP